MTAKELIERLQGFPPETQVFIAPLDPDFGPVMLDIDTVSRIESPVYGAAAMIEAEEL
ncbi:MAG: hypothetical protein LBU43_12470 [Candidatus Accumulibacter sp.]|jgi:hypothetical protein|nr:hypothetical protein [Accumulibacter sp.]